VDRRIFPSAHCPRNRCLSFPRAWCKAARREIAKPREEFRCRGRVGSRLGRIADGIGNGGTLFIRDPGKWLAESALRFRFYPLQPGKNDFPIRPLLRIRSADPFVDETTTPTDEAAGETSSAGMIRSQSAMVVSRAAVEREARGRPAAILS
jgi:hypothetical protein